MNVPELTTLNPPRLPFYREEFYEYFKTLRTYILKEWDVLLKPAIAETMVCRRIPCNPLASEEVERKAFREAAALGYLEMSSDPIEHVRKGIALVLSRHSQLQSMGNHPKTVLLRIQLSTEALVVYRAMSILLAQAKERSDKGGNFQSN